MTPQNINPMADNPNDYFLPLDATEIGRVDLQARLIAPYLPLLPPGIELEAPHILDIACGPGRWVFDIARTYPEAQVTGIDISQKMITYAQMHTQMLPNAHFAVMDARNLSSLPDSSFDFVNARTIQAFMKLSDWPGLVAECKRITRLGGWLRLCESEAPFTNSKALEELYRLILHMMWERGWIYSPSGRQGGVFPLLASLLRQGGWQQVQQAMSIIDIGYGQPAHINAYKDHEIGVKSIKAFLSQVYPPEQVEQLAQQALEDFKSEQFSGVWLFLSAWGQKG